MTRAFRPRTMLATAAVIVAAASVGGCSEFSPQTTQLQYAASDGVMGDEGTLGVRNLMLITGEEGGEANIIGTLVNHSDKPIKVQLGPAGGSPQTVSVPANASVALDAGEGETGVEETTKVKLKPTTITAKAGALTEFVVTDGTNQLTLQTPVLDGTLPEYSTLTPAAAPSTAPSASASPSESGESVSESGSGSASATATP